MPSLAVDGSGTELSYTDSGPPARLGLVASYTTLFAFHTTGFNGGIFRKVQALAPASNLRFVAVNRRGYAGSTPLSAAESTALVAGTDAQKAAHLAARGAEAATFIAAFARKFTLPPEGGVAVLGWGAGGGVALACVPELPAELRAQLRALILQEPPSLVLGFAPPADTWSPHLDPSIPPAHQAPFRATWITSYFAQPPVLAAPAPAALAHIVPSPARAPTMYALSARERAEIVDARASELPGQYAAMEQARAVWRGVLRLGGLRAVMLCGAETVSFGVAALWAVREELEGEGRGGAVEFAVVDGANHFMHWDDPEKTLQAYLRALD